MINCLRATVAIAAASWLCISHAAESLKTGGPYVPTPQIVVDQMLRFANVGEKDFVIDLGSGDGVIVLTAARDMKASGVGIEIDEELVALSNDSARKLGVANRVQFVQQDIFKADLSKASVLTLYLLPSMMSNLRSKVFNELKPGTRVVSHDYYFGEWTADDQITFDVPEKEKINGVPKATIYQWFVPAKIAGTWEVKVAGGETYELALKQRYQNVDASVAIGGKSVRPQHVTLRGSEFSMALSDGKGVARFSGRVSGNTMEGAVDVPGSKAPARWSATRTAAASVMAA